MEITENESINHYFSLKYYYSIPGVDWLYSEREYCDETEGIEIFYSATDPLDVWVLNNGNYSLFSSGQSAYGYHLVNFWQLKEEATVFFQYPEYDYWWVIIYNPQSVTVNCNAYVYSHYINAEIKEVTVIEEDNDNDKYTDYLTVAIEVGFNVDWARGTITVKGYLEYYNNIEVDSDEKTVESDGFSGNVVNINLSPKEKGNYLVHIEVYFSSDYLIDDEYRSNERYKIYLEGRLQRITTIIVTVLSILAFIGISVPTIVKIIRTKQSGRLFHTKNSIDEWFAENGNLIITGILSICWITALIVKFNNKKIAQGGFFVSLLIITWIFSFVYFLWTKNYIGLGYKYDSSSDNSESSISNYSTREPYSSSSYSSSILYSSSSYATLKSSSSKTYIDENGYRRFTKWNKLVHRWIFEKTIKRKLKYYEVVHHKNGIKLDNRKENLVVMNRDDHELLHFGQGYSLDDFDIIELEDY